MSIQRISMESGVVVDLTDFQCVDKTAETFFKIIHFGWDIFLINKVHWKCQLLSFLFLTTQLWIVCYVSKQLINFKLVCDVSGLWPAILNPLFVSKFLIFVYAVVAKRKKEDKKGLFYHYKVAHAKSAFLIAVEL